MYLSYRSVLWHFTVKVEIEKPGDNIIFKTAERENNFEVKSLGRKHSVILNQVNFNHTNDNSNHVDFNHVDLNKLISANLKNIGSIDYSADISASHQIFSWDRDRQTQQVVYFLREHLLTYLQYIHPI